MLPGSPPLHQLYYTSKVELGGFTPEGPLLAYITVSQMTLSLEPL